MTERFLNDAERERFAAWLDQEATQGEAMAKQMEAKQMETLGQQYAPIIKRERAEALAAKVIAAKLRSYEPQTISR